MLFYSVRHWTVLSTRTGDIISDPAWSLRDAVGLPSRRCRNGRGRRGLFAVAAASKFTDVGFGLWGVEVLGPARFAAGTDGQQRFVVARAA